MDDLIKYKKNITSQWGEDGIIEEIFKRIKIENKICVEFGAWDGKHYSNTWNLWHEKDWATVLIEADTSRIKMLKDETSNFPKTIALRAFVEIEGKNSLDNILDKLNINKKIDLISIDIDGNDYYIFESLKKHTPRVIVIEYNPTIPPELNIVQKKGEYFGSSAKALCNLARKKGYKLVTVTDTNCIFVENQEFLKLQIKEPLLENIFNKNHISHIITSYDGKPFVDRIPPYTNLDTAKYNKILPQFISKQKLTPIYLKRNESFSKILLKSLKLKIKLSIKRMFFFKKLKKILYYFTTRKNNIWNYFMRKKKERMILFYQKKYNIQILIETGTHMGGMITAMLNYFKYIYSIELSIPLFDKAKEKFKNEKKVILFQGDSGETIPKILNIINEPCLFWLDAHYSKGNTVRGDKDTPIIKELENILNHHIKKHIILIDDARCFNGTNDYPKISEIKKFVEKKSQYTVKVNNDIFQITNSNKH